MDVHPPGRRVFQALFCFHVCSMLVHFVLVHAFHAYVEGGGLVAAASCVSWGV